MTEFNPALPEPNKAEAMDHAPLYVSLYIVILAFFILLNTMSTYEVQKAELVVQSVKKTFAYDKPQAEVVDNATNDPAGAAREKFMWAIEAHARRTIPLEYLVIERDGTLIQVQVPSAILFIGSNTELNPVNSKLLKGFADTVSAMSAELEITLDVLLDISASSDFGFAYAKPDRVEVQQAGVLARYFLKNGVAKHQVITGLKQEKNPRFVTLRFRTQPLPAPQKEGEADAATQSR